MKDSNRELTRHLFTNNGDNTIVEVYASSRSQARDNLAYLLASSPFTFLNNKWANFSDTDNPMVTVQDKLEWSGEVDEEGYYDA